MIKYSITRTLCLAHNTKLILSHYQNKIHEYMVEFKARLIKISYTLSVIGMIH